MPLAAAVDRALAGDTPASVDSALEAIAARLLRVPPADDLDAATIDVIVRRADEVARADVAVALHLFAVVGAWHLDDGSCRDRAAAWMVAARRAADDPATDSEALKQIAVTLVETGALLDLIDVAPDDAIHVLARAADRQLAVAGGELSACQLALEAARWRQVTRGAGAAGPIALGDELLATAATRLATAFQTRPLPCAPREVATTLLAAFEAIGDAQHAQLMRLNVINGMLDEGLVQQAEPLLSALASPVVIPEQDAVGVFLRARTLALRGRVQDAIRQLSARGPDWSAGMRINADTMLADLYAVQGRWRDALSLLTPAAGDLDATSAQQMPVELVVRRWVQTALVAARLGEAATLDDAVDALRTLGPVSPMARVGQFVATAAVLRIAGDRDRAQASLADGLALVESMIVLAPDHIAAQGMYAVRATLAAQLATLAAERGAPTDAFDAAERGRGSFLRSATAERATVADAGGPMLLIDAARRRLRPPGTPATDAARVEIERLRQAPLAATVRMAPEAIDADARRAAVDLIDACGPTWMVATVSLDPYGAAVVSATDGVDWAVQHRPFTDVELASTMQRTFQQEYFAGPQPTNAVWRRDAERCLQQLGTLVGDPLVELAAGFGRTRVMLSVPGALSSVPLSALRLSAGDLLVDRLDACTVLQGTGWAAELSSRAISRPRTTIVVGAVADPTIPLAAAEARMVAECWRGRGAAVRLLQPFDQRAIRDGVGEAVLVHLASHASFDVRAVASSGLRLGADDSLDSGELFAGLDLDGTDLVVLSACDTASSSLTASGEAVNLGAFALMAGSLMVIGSLWPVVDESALWTMVLLHEHMAGGLSPPEALFAAQRGVRGMTNSDRLARWATIASEVPTPDDVIAAIDRGPAANPFGKFDAWAPFVCSGAPARIRPPVSTAVERGAS